MKHAIETILKLYYNSPPEQLVDDLVSLFEVFEEKEICAELHGDMA